MAAEPPWSFSKPTRRREMSSMWSPEADMEAAVCGTPSDVVCWSEFRENSSIFLVSAFVSSS
jgi:hypothetical protein